LFVGHAYIFCRELCVGHFMSSYICRLFWEHCLSDTFCRAF
jgi:hypothetical protein